MTVRSSLLGVASCGLLALPLLCCGHPVTVVNQVAANAAGGTPPVATANNNQSGPQKRSAVSGVKQKIGFFAQLNADCSSVGFATVVVKTPPAHGTFTTEHGEAFTNYAKDNQRYSCNLKPSPATLAYYTSVPGYVGSDTVTVSVVYADGASRVTQFDIAVEAAR